MADIEQATLNQIKNLKTQTGKSFDYWKQIAAGSWNSMCSHRVKIEGK